MNPYQVLGLQPDASEDDIKKTYRRLAMEWHPDRNKSPEAEQKIKEINEAFDYLTNKPQPAMHWIINGEEIRIRNWDDVDLQWERIHNLMHEMFKDFR